MDNISTALTRDHRACDGLIDAFKESVTQRHWFLECTAQPIMTVDGVRMAKKHMFYSSAKAERRLGYTHRPAAAALRDAIAWFHSHAYLR